MTSSNRNMHRFSMYESWKKEQPNKARRIQVWWRRVLEVREAKKPLRRIFESDVTGLTGLRCLVLIGVHDDVLGTWAKAMIQLGPEAFLARGLGEHGTSWLVLMRKAALLLVLSLAYVPRSPNASLYLDVLVVLLSNKQAVATSAAQGRAFCQAITAYLIKQQFYRLLRQAISKLPIENSTSFQPFLTLCMLPLSTFPENSPQFKKICVGIFAQVLSLPSLPNRLPLDCPPIFLSYFLLTTPDTVKPLIELISDRLSACSSSNLVANLFMAVSPHYKMLSTQAFASYLQLSVMLFNRFNISSWLNVNVESNNEADYRDSRLQFCFCHPTLPVTGETLRWILKIPTPQHISELINLTHSQTILLPHLAAYLFALTAMRPPYRQEIKNIVLTTSNGGLVGELYREVVARSSLGQKADSMNVYESPRGMPWPHIIFFADLYSQALHTMDDYEFFDMARGSRGCNPLTLEEVTSFSVKLLNIMFMMYSQYSEYWNESRSIQNTCISSDVFCSWKALREKLIRCLSRIHARDSRRPFLFLGRCLLRSELEMNTFIDAAVASSRIYEQRPSGTYSRMPSDVTRYQSTSMSPQLSIFKKIPFAIPFEVRVSIFQHLIVTDRVLHGSTERLNSLGHDQGLRVRIRREEVVLGGFRELAGVNLNAPLEIVMTDGFGQEEEEVDGRGHFKEFLMAFFQEAMYDGLWFENVRGELYPTTHGYAIEANSLNWFWFTGYLIGKAMYDGILMDIPFATFFLVKCLGRTSFFDDLFSLDLGLYRQLFSLKHSSKNINIEDLSLHFSITIEESGVTKTVDLIPNGHKIAVTRENRLRYIDLVTRYRMDTQFKRQSEAFLAGLSHIIQPEWLKMFDQRELQILIAGVPGPIDLDDLRRHTTYQGIYHNSHETINVFWQVVDSFHHWQKRSFLAFVTNCDRPHVLGFKELVPNFTIHDDGSDENRLPSSSRRVNLLKVRVGHFLFPL
ncbi:hypothetical protein GALMADRAFT_146508 [Galerina marginata CBS 339.88]|uniref:HECT-type E3 ubiquitin transferase n=1 Tax=Galerina marginata (strain CBS 339.88) TaxID=685588 RepID=A0A067SNB7_GALM3|nr:hypothetical protein GALMADRAFT_146508 [Galerina marginata CBS 339.88]